MERRHLECLRMGQGQCRSPGLHFQTLISIVLTAFRSPAERYGLQGGEGFHRGFGRRPGNLQALCSRHPQHIKRRHNVRTCRECPITRIAPPSHKLQDYLELQASLSAALRAGFLSLAQARYSMGPDRVSAVQFPSHMRATARLHTAGVPSKPFASFCF